MPKLGKLLALNYEKKEKVRKKSILIYVLKCFNGQIQFQWLEEMWWGQLCKKETKKRNSCPLKGQDRVYHPTYHGNVTEVDVHLKL